ncbi:MAG: DUF350 domain-containing protein [Bacteroidetes bacterium]|nr:DUF350 domain-containing protein [Bacteroidota bacterium]
MDYNIIFLNIVYAFIGLVVLIVAYKLFDLVESRIDFAEQINKGNMAASVFISSVMIALAIIIAGALG